MSATPNNTTDISPDVMADAQLVAECVAAGRPVPDEVYQRVRERSELITEELRQKYGELNVAVDLIRETRVEE